MADRTVPASIPAAALNFAAALGKLKAKHEMHEGANLTADEVDGIIWGIKQLRGGLHDAAEARAAQRSGAAAGGR